MEGGLAPRRFALRISDPLKIHGGIFRGKFGERFFFLAKQYRAMEGFLGATYAAVEGRGTRCRLVLGYTYSRGQSTRLLFCGAVAF